MGLTALIIYAASCSRISEISVVVEAKTTSPSLPSSSASASAAIKSSASALTHKKHTLAHHVPLSFLPKRAGGHHRLLSPTDQDVIAKIRGGSSGEESEEYDTDEEDESSDDEEEYDSDSDEYDSDTEEEDEEDEYDSESEEEEEEEEESSSIVQSSLKASILSKSHQDTTDSDSEEGALVEYDDLLTPPAMQQFVISIGVMMLSNRIDILNEKAVKIARFAFLGYVLVTQLFLLYVRLRAKSMDDRTPITISNPLASLVPNGANGGAGGVGGNFMVKALADQVLSTQTTVLEYDLKQVKKVNGGLLFPMVFLYFLHFKMKQVQPLLMQTATGFSNLVYSPLFQVYVLGRSLERPFKPPTSPMMEALQKQQEGQEEEGEDDDDGEGGAEVSEEEDEDEEGEDESEEYEVEEEGSEDEEDSEGEEESDDESEYDDSDEE